MDGSPNETPIPDTPCVSLSDVAAHLRSLNEFFCEHIDRGWLTTQLDDLPVDRLAYRHIRLTLALSVVHQAEMPGIVSCVEGLFSFVEELRRYLLPVLRDRLGISGLTRSRLRLDQVTRVQRELLCIAFPYNLEELERRTIALRDLLRVYSQQDAVSVA